MPRGAPLASRSPLLLLRMLERTSHGVHRRCSRARSERGYVCPCAQDASSTWSRCGRSAALPAAGCSGRSEQRSRAQRAPLSRTAHGHSSLFDGARVLLAAGPRRPLIGGRACEAARARVRRMQRDGRLAFCFHSVGLFMAMSIRAGMANAYETDEMCTFDVFVSFLDIRCG